MKVALLFLVLTATILCPGASWADPPVAAEPERGVGREMKDSWITSKTKVAFVTDKRVKARRIKVETQQGVVTLRGKVASADERNAAEQIARGIGGVSAVRNTLEVVPEASRQALDAKDDEIAKAIRDRLDSDEQLKGAHIRVRADNGMVTLMGTVPSARAKDHAVEVARKTVGVRGVRSELRPKS
jgi:osmotically-inducible protein OsmY